MIKSIRVQLLPNNKQKTKLFQFAGAARYAYNWALNKQMNHFCEGHKIQTDSALRKEFTVLRHAEENKWLQDVSNNVTKQAIKDLCIAYKNCFRKQKQPGYIKYASKKIAHYNRIGKSLTVYDMNGHPKFRSKKNGDFRFYQDNVKIQFTETHVKLESLAGSRRKNRQRLNWIRLAERNRIPVRAKYTNPRIAFDGERWWLSVGIQTARKLKPLRGLSFAYRKRRYTRSEGIGIDLGIKDLAVLSDATKVRNINSTDSLVGNRLTSLREQGVSCQSLRSIISNVSSLSFGRAKTDAMNEERNIKVSFSSTGCGFL